MEQSRFLGFIVLSLAIIIGWQYLGPRPPVPPQQVAKKDVAKDGAKDGKDKQLKLEKKPESDAKVADKKGGSKSDDVADKDQPAVDKGSDKAGADAKTPPVDEAPKPKQFPPAQVKLGSIEFESGYCMFVTLTSRGAAVSQIELTDPRYRDLIKPHPPLKIVNPGPGPVMTLQTAIPQFGFDLNRTDWEVVPDSKKQSEVTFRMTSADGNVEILKHYAVVKQEPPKPETVSEYELRLDITVKNRGKEDQIINYELQGPVGLPLENIDNTQKFRDVVVGFVDDDKTQRMTAKEIAENAANNKVEEWQRPLKYIGVDVQYFAALVLPDGDQLTSPYIKSSKQMLVGPNEREKSDISVVLTSIDLDLAGQAGKGKGPHEVTHSYRLFAGPKRNDLLSELGAMKVIDYGMFWWVSQPMLWLLNTFYAIFHNYGMSIICLTVLVRCCMFPISIKQARSMVKMQELQPEIAALKEKYGKDREKMAKAQMELFSKNNYSPFGGCLPALFQLPIFMGLYQALSNAVTLRMAHFLWIENLAAPDALFQLPFRVPFVGWTEFNLLPVIASCLYFLQSKMFTPPPQNEEQALQQKMMSYMMIFMGVMFYRVPAGLCVYFIASSLWSMAERKLLPKAKIAPPPLPLEKKKLTSDSRNSDTDDEEKPLGFWGTVLKAAEKDAGAKKGIRRNK